MRDRARSLACFERRSYAHLPTTRDTWHRGAAPRQRSRARTTARFRLSSTSTTRNVGRARRPCSCRRMRASRRCTMVRAAGAAATRHAARAPSSGRHGARAPRGRRRAAPGSAATDFSCARMDAMASELCCRREDGRHGGRGLVAMLRASRGWVAEAPLPPLGRRGCSCAASESGARALARAPPRTSAGR